MKLFLNVAYSVEKHSDALYVPHRSVNIEEQRNSEPSSTACCQSGDSPLCKHNWSLHFFQAESQSLFNLTRTVVQLKINNSSWITKPVLFIYFYWQ